MKEVLQHIPELVQALGKLRKAKRAKQIANLVQLHIKGELASAADGA